MLKIIIHYEQEGLDSYSYLVELTQKEFDEIKSAHSHFINSTDDKEAEKAIRKIYFMIGPKNKDSLEDAKEEKIDASWVGKFENVNPIETALYEPISGFIACGWA